MRTSPTASASWSTSRSARSPTPPSKTPQLQCKRSTDYHDILRQLAPRPFPDGRHRDEAGQVRLTMKHDELGGLRSSRLRRDPSGRAPPRVVRAHGDTAAESGSHRPSRPSPLASASRSSTSNSTCSRPQPKRRSATPAMSLSRSKTIEKESRSSRRLARHHAGPDLSWQSFTTRRRGSHLVDTTPRTPGRHRTLQLGHITGKTPQKRVTRKLSHDRRAPTPTSQTLQTGHHGWPPVTSVFLTRRCGHPRGVGARGPRPTRRREARSYRSAPGRRSPARCGPGRREVP